MRNLHAFPLLKGEVLGILRQLRDNVDAEGACGDVRPYALQRVAEFVERAATDADFREPKS